MKPKINITYKPSQHMTITFTTPDGEEGIVLSGVKAKLMRNVIKWPEKSVLFPTSDSRLIFSHDDFGSRLTIIINKVGLNFRLIPSQTFMMGSSKDEPNRRDDETLHPVKLTKYFWIAELVVTNQLWNAVYSTTLKHPELPKVDISYYGAIDFCEELNNLVKIPYVFDLPTEAEWECACRAGTTTAYSTGKTITSAQANVDSDKLLPAKSFKPNPLGLYQMHGNVWEWCKDYWQRNLGDQLAVDPQGPKIGMFRVVRGGSWLNRGGLEVYPAILRGKDPNNHYHSLGFRLVLRRKQ